MCNFMLLKNDFLSFCGLLLFGNMLALEIICSFCFDKWEKCTTFANVKVCENWLHSLQNAKNKFYVSLVGTIFANVNETQVCVPVED